MKFYLSIVIGALVVLVLAILYSLMIWACAYMICGTFESVFFWLVAFGVYLLTFPAIALLLYRFIP